MMTLHFWSAGAVSPLNRGRRGGEGNYNTQLCVFTSALFCLCKKMPSQSFPMKLRHLTNIIRSDWYSIMLWAVLQNRWQVLSVFKYCKKKISYNCYKAELFVAFFFFNVEVTLYVCLVSVSILVQSNATGWAQSCSAAFFFWANWDRVHKTLPWELCWKGLCWQCLFQSKRQATTLSCTRTKPDTFV